MKPRYNLRLVTQHRTNPSLLSSRANKAKPIDSHVPIESSNRRHSLRLTSTGKEAKSRPSVSDTISKCREVDSDNPADLFARHHRHMLEEQKDRRLYERHVREQRALRRLQCRRTHTAHLNDATRNRLLRELERERRYTLQAQICTHVREHTIAFRQPSKVPMTWSTLEEEVLENSRINTIQELDVMISNLTKAIRNSKSSVSKPRLSVRERQTQRLAAAHTSMKLTRSSSTELSSPHFVSNSMMNSLTQQTPASFSPRVPLVRFIDNQNLRTSNAQHLTCIQNVLSHDDRLSTDELFSPLCIRKSFLRPKSPVLNTSDASPAIKRPLEKENCSIVTATSPPTHSNVIVRERSPMVSIRHTASTSSSRSYPNTRKYSISQHFFTTRRQTEVSANV